MEPLDNFDDKFKAAASRDEQQPLPSLDRVWQRVEAKMDHKALKTESRMWKKWAIAASVLLAGTVGYQIFKPESKINMETVAAPPQIEIVPQIPPIITDSAQTVAVESNIHPQAERILRQQTQIPAVAINEADEIQAPEPLATPSIQSDDAVEPAQKNAQRSLLKEEADEFEFTPIPARGVKRIALKAKSDGGAKDEPLYVLDGKISNKAETEAADVETVVKLDEPLYIINGKEYSEKEMFGPNPTSPYAPLAEQDIESISILQGKEATDAYGSKGRKGVVIVKTKNGKPKPKAR